MKFRQFLAPAISLAMILGFTSSPAQERDSSIYEDPAPLEVARLLPETMLRSAQHQVTGVQAANGNRVVFTIDSEIAGHQQVESIPLALIRIKEILTLAQARSQFVQDNPTTPDEDRGKIKVRGDSFVGILADPFSTSAKVVGQFGSNVGQTLGELGTFPGPKGKTGASTYSNQAVDPVFASHRRNIASQLGLDIYSSNVQVQVFLDNMARARINGQGRAGITTVSLNQPVEVSIDGGKIDNRIRTSVLNQDRSDLFHRNEILLREAGVGEALIKKFLASTATSPSHKTAITEYLVFLKGVKHRDALIQAALAASNEVEALATVAMLRMFAHYHENWSPLLTFIPAGHLTLGLSRDGTLLVALPFDILYWDRESESIFDALNRFAEDKGILNKTLVLLGAATDNARNDLEQRGFQTLERFLYKR